MSTVHQSVRGIKDRRHPKVRAQRVSKVEHPSRPALRAGEPQDDVSAAFLYPSVPCQPCLEMSKITPSGSLNLRSKLPCRSSPRSKKNLPPLASMRLCVSARSST